MYSLLNFYEFKIRTSGVKEIRNLKKQTNKVQTLATISLG